MDVSSLFQPPIHQKITSETHFEALTFGPSWKFSGSIQVPIKGPAASPKAAEALKMDDTAGDTACRACAAGMSPSWAMAASTMLGSTGVQQRHQPKPINSRPPILVPKLGHARNYVKK